MQGGALLTLMSIHISKGLPTLGYILFTRKSFTGPPESLKNEMLPIDKQQGWWKEREEFADEWKWLLSKQQ